MAETKNYKKQLEELQAELSTIDFEENPEEYKKVAREMHKVAKKYNSEKVKLRLPSPRANEDKYEFIGWNGTGYSIKKGVEVEVPRAVAMIYEQSEAQKDSTYDLINGLTEEYEAESK